MNLTIAAPKKTVKKGSKPKPKPKMVSQLNV